MIFLLKTLLSSVFITIMLVPGMRSLAIRMNALDIPDERKVHTRPIPRIGGVAMAVGVFIPLLCFAEINSFIVAYLAGAALLVLVGLADDLSTFHRKSSLLLR